MRSIRWLGSIIIIGYDTPHILWNEPNRNLRWPRNLVKYTGWTSNNILYTKRRIISQNNLRKDCQSEDYQTGHFFRYIIITSPSRSEGEPKFRPCRTTTTTVQHSYRAAAAPSRTLSKVNPPPSTISAISWFFCARRRCPSRVIAVGPPGSACFSWFVVPPSRPSVRASYINRGGGDGELGRSRAFSLPRSAAAGEPARDGIYFSM